MGKTTTATALAAGAAARGERVLLLSTDPARILGAVLGIPLGVEPRGVPGLPGVEAAQLEAKQARASFLERWRDILLLLVDRGTYLDGADAAALVDATLPGGDETFAVLRLAELSGESRWTRVVVDTAPTGHTLRLLDIPGTLHALLRLLDAFQEKHRMLVRALSRRYRADDADRFLADTRARLESLDALLQDGSRSAAVVVTRPERLVVEESVRLCAGLRQRAMRVGAVVANALPSRSPAARRLLDPLREVTPDVPWVVVPRLDVPPASVEGARAWAREMRAWKDPSRGGPPTGNLPDSPQSDVTPPTPSVPVRPLRPLTIIGGKGGVGKTTLACALGIASADAGCTTLIVSTDPAASVADALAQDLADDERAVHGVANLWARQLDASASFDQFRRAYGDRIGDAIRGIAPLTGRGSDALDGLLAVAPPGIDELYAITWLGDALAARRYERVIVDPAPTGHLLRLLELPPVALDWTHELMRLLLKYRTVVPFGDAAEGLLDFARQTKAVQAMLADHERATLLVTALDEPLVREESARLVNAVRALGVHVGAIVWNRAPRPVHALAIAPPVAQYQLPESADPPRGVRALRAWLAGWRELES